MAVQARHLSHAFPHDLHGDRAMADATAGGSLSLDESAGCVSAAAGIGDTTVLGDLPRSELTCNYGFEPRKRVVLPPTAGMQGLVPLPVGDVQSRAPASGAPSISGREANGASVSGELLSRLISQGMEIDALIRLESERMRAGLEEARRRHSRALLAAAEHAASGRLRVAEDELGGALRRNADLEEKARQMGAE
uniref:Uncharacterized protein n=1 Tax=Arundo donax TaxID=35708 RepID=A0A0A9AY03_ARUDO